MLDRFSKAKEGVEKPQKAPKPEKSANEINREKGKIKPEKFSRTGSINRKPIMVAAAVAVLVLALFYGNISRLLFGSAQPGSSSTQEQPDNNLDNSNNGDSNASDSKAALDLASLAAGTYAGTIDNLVPGVKSPLLLLSSGKSVTVIVGVAGWLPVRLPVPEDGQQATTNTTLRSNGIMIVISGQGENGALKGEFRDVLTGDRGTWSDSAVGDKA